MDKEKRDEALNEAVENTKRKLKLPRAVKPQKVMWMGELVRRTDIQKDLDKMAPGEKVVYLTENRRGEVYSRLEKLAEEDRLEDGEALYLENQETLDYDNADAFDDFDEASWFSSKWLVLLRKHKQQLKYWQSYKRGEDV